jgi:hypothetical protein
MDIEKLKRILDGFFAWVTPWKTLILFLFVNLLVGIFIVGDYGNIADENFEIAREVFALKMYSIPSIDEIPKLSQTKNEIVLKYGTAIPMLFQLAENIFRSVLGIHPRVVAHYTYFILFEIGVVAFYLIMRRFVGDWMALVATVLFATQPLYFGHAFINPKDTPLMSIFLVTLAAGFSMVEKYSNPFQINRIAASQEEENIINCIKTFFRNKLYLTGLNILMLVVILFPGSILSALKMMTTGLYKTPSSSFLGKIFSLIAAEKSSISLEYYLDKLEFLYFRYVIPILWIIVLGQLIFLLFLFISGHKSVRGMETTPPPGKSSKAESLESRRLVILAGFVWGLCMATRFIGFAAGGLVLLYFLLQAGKRSLVPAAMYTCAAVLTMYLFWPYLWHVHISELVNITQLLNDFPHPTSVLFDGVYYSSYRLPAAYLPKLLVYQFSEPVVLLTVAGIFASVYLLISKRLNWKVMAIVFCWFFIPFFYVILNRTPLYNNFRHLLFITPPLFILAGTGLREITRFISRRWAGVVMVIIFLLPGVYGLFQLHPFQYIYYNGYVGGVAGAYRNYELDYWMTSLKESAEYINRVAEPDSSVCFFYIGKSLSANYLRPDIQIINTERLLSMEDPEVDMVVLPPRLNADLEYFVDVPIAHQVLVDGVSLATIKIIH